MENPKKEEQKTGNSYRIYFLFCQAGVKFFVIAFAKYIYVNC